MVAGEDAGTKLERARQLGIRTIDEGAFRTLVGEESSMDDADIARVLDEVADLLEILGQNQFRIRAYRTAARTVETLPEPAAKIVVRDPMELCELGGIGKDLAGKIGELATTGDFNLHRELLQKVPVGLTMMMRVSGVGAKRTKLFFDRLHLRSVEELEAAAKDGKLHDIRGIGEALEKRILQGLCRAALARGSRPPLRSGRPRGAAAVEYMRRSRARRGDQHRREPAPAARDDRRSQSARRIAPPGRGRGALLRAYPEITTVLVRGGTKCSVVLRSGIQVDLRVVCRCAGVRRCTTLRDRRRTTSRFVRSVSGVSSRSTSTACFGASEDRRAHRRRYSARWGFR